MKIHTNAHALTHGCGLSRHSSLPAYTFIGIGVNRHTKKNHGLHLQ